MNGKTGVSGGNPSVARRENPTDINLDEGFIATK